MTPKIKGFDWEHIFKNHAPWGENALRRTRQHATIFEGLDEKIIRKRVENAWENRKLISRQNDGTVIRHYYEGYDSTSGQKIGFWFNEDTELVETAYPILN